jgi:hypothetical protein
MSGTTPSVSSGDTARSRRTFSCGAQQYTAVTFSDGLVAIFDDSTALLAGWPLTASISAQDLESRSDEELCAKLAHIGVRVSNPDIRKP